MLKKVKIWKTFTKSIFYIYNHIFISMYIIKRYGRFFEMLQLFENYKKINEISIYHLVRWNTQKFREYESLVRIGASSGLCRKISSIFCIIRSTVLRGVIWYHGAFCWWRAPVLVHTIPCSVCNLHSISIN